MGGIPARVMKMRGETKGMRRAAIVGTGSYLPEDVRRNDFFEGLSLKSVDEVYFDHTGAEERRIAPPYMKSSDMEYEAGKRAIESAGIKPEEIDLIIVSSLIPDEIQPQNAALIQHKLGAKSAAAINLDSACSSFINGLIVANSLIANGTCNAILVISAAITTRTLDYTDTTCTMFGDGAGAAVLKPAKTRGCGLIVSDFFSDGSFYYTMGRKLKKPRGYEGMKNYIEQLPERVMFYVDKEKRYEELKDAAKNRPAENAKRALQKAGLTSADIDHLFLHQPHKLLIDCWREGIGVPKEKTYDTLKKYGNISNASIPVTLDEVVRSSKIKRNDIVVFCSQGLGFNFSTAIFRWE